MNCQLCNKEITSKLTGDLCTSCYFKSKSPKVIEKENTTEIGVLDVQPIPEIPEQSNKGTKSVNPRVEGNESTSNGNDSELAGADSINDDESGIPIDKEKLPIVSKSDVPQDGIKYCQSCLERGFGLVIATREWTTDYFICDDCFEPLLNNIINPNDNELRILKDNPTIDINKPILNQFYDLLGIPEQLRFNRADTVLSSRNDIFNYHAPAILNKDLKEVASEIEQLQIMLFQIKIAIEPRQDYINRIKHSEREKANLSSIEKGKKEFSKSGPSKVKQGQDQKMADTLFKAVENNAEKRLKMYLDLQKQAREQEFKNRTGT